MTFVINEIQRKDNQVNNENSQNWIVLFENIYHKKSDTTCKKIASNS